MDRQGTERLLHRLDLEPVEASESGSTWRGVAGKNAMNMSGALFGGFVLAQTVVAAGRAVPDRRIHSLHQNFLLAGQPSGPIDYRVEKLFEGRTYANARVEIRQGGSLISHATIGYTTGVDGPEQQETVTPRGDFAATVNRDELRGNKRWRDQPIEMRVVPDHAADGVANLDLWFRPASELPQDHVMSQAFVAYASDRAFLGTAWKPMIAEHGFPRGASLEHSIVFHSRFQFDDWLVFSMSGPALIDGRGLSQGSIHRSDGTRVATVTQQGSLRIRGKT